MIPKATEYLIQRLRVLKSLTLMTWHLECSEGLALVAESRLPFSEITQMPIFFFIYDRSELDFFSTII